ncbi:transposon Tf2-6 polyprotein [Trichonephila clavipes]|nr:transposon Tf2-6 polyprotein [Trichonephila clavipes]
MPFGLSTCPSTFQRFINTVFHDLVVQGIVIPYMDDIVILAKNESEAIDRLKKVLKVSSDYGLEMNFDKCLTGYFSKFFPAYSVIAKPLSDLLRKDTPFNFNVEQKASFDELKRLLCQKPVLGIYRQNCETEIHTDASIDGLAAVLLQRSPDDNSLHPIYYMSRKMSETERKYTSYELEVLAIIETLKKFKVYILGMPFKIITDCNAFTKTMSKKDLNTRIAHWALNLQDYDYTILHRSGSQMAHVDALSRIQVLTNQCTDSIVHRIKESQELDPHILSIKALLQNGPYDNYCIKNNILFKFIDGAEVLVIPDEMQHHFIKNAHDKGHFLVKRTLEHIKK